jgi:hydroxypyruvate reductase
MPTRAQARQDLLKVFEAAVTAVNGGTRVLAALQGQPLEERVYVIALGKAAVPMMQGALDALGSRIRDAVIVTKDAGGVTLPWPVIESGHPLPDARSLAAGDRVFDFAGQIPPEAQVLVLLSGGASALVEKLAAGIDLATLQRITRWMLATGLDIAAMNRIRKRLSLIKGGRLAQRLYPRRTLCLAISDVAGDDPRAIGSGPLVAEGGDELELADAPAFVRDALRQAAPLPAPADACFDAVQFKIIATLADAKRAAAEAAAGIGYRTVVEPEFVSGDALVTGAEVAERLLSAEPNVIHIWGGETTVRLPERPGRGGRNQSLALSAALRLEGSSVMLLAAGTDGTDGPTEDAGALIDGGTIVRGAEAGLDARRALAAADAGTFLDAAGDLIHTGPTGTNVMDLVLGLGIVT